MLINKGLWWGIWQERGRGSNRITRIARMTRIGKRGRNRMGKEMNFVNVNV